VADRIKATRDEATETRRGGFGPFRRYQWLIAPGQGRSMNIPANGNSTCCWRLASRRPIALTAIALHAIKVDAVLLYRRAGWHLYDAAYTMAKIKTINAARSNTTCRPQGGDCRRFPGINDEGQITTLGAAVPI